MFHLYYYVRSDYIFVSFLKVPNSPIFTYSSSFLLKSSFGPCQELWKNMVERNVGMVCLYKLLARAKYEQPKLAKSSHETEGRRFPGEKHGSFSSFFQCFQLRISSKCFSVCSLAHFYTNTPCNFFFWAIVLQFKVNGR